MRASSFYQGALLLHLLLPLQAAGSGFRVPPYLQNPSADGMTVIWFSEDGTPGQLTYRAEGEANENALASEPVRAEALVCPAWEEARYFDGGAQAAPFRHRVRLAGLLPGTTYTYTVEQKDDRFVAAFTTAPRADQPIRFIAYADSEVEPESTGRHAYWSPEGVNPFYPLDQTEAYAANLAVIRSRDPDFVTISGDLVQSGGEQRDWDEFWRHNADADAERNLAGRVPILAAPGNHDYYEGPDLGGYSQPGSERAMARFLTYFEFPGNAAPDPAQQGRYYRLDYGPITLISLDVVNGSPHASEYDTNFALLGERDPGGGPAPDFGPGSAQYGWLEAQLEDAQRTSPFTFVMLHHSPYSVGPHGWPACWTRDCDTLSGVPVRVLTPLFMRCGVDAVLAGHDELWERSVIEGTEVGPDGQALPHCIHFYDVGTGGDGLRSPAEGLENPYQRFLAHRDAPGIWRDSVLVDGGTHYGHLEVDVLPAADGAWQAILTPAYVFPLLSADGTYLGSERRVYDDVVTLTRMTPTAVALGQGEAATPPGLETPYPNPFNGAVVLRYGLEADGSVELAVYDLMGQRVRTLIQGHRSAGYHSVAWDARDGTRRPVGSGVYLVKLQTSALRDIARVVLLR